MSPGLNSVDSSIGIPVIGNIANEPSLQNPPQTASETLPNTTNPENQNTPSQESSGCFSMV